LSLRYEEAVVLADLLARWEHDGTADSLSFQDQAEQRVLWDLAASLEPFVDEVFSSNYKEAVAAARAAVRDIRE
jgi:hypothetical protein